MAGVVVLAALVGGAAVAPAADAASAVTGTRSASVSRESCTTSPTDPRRRAASFTVLMRRHANTRHYAFAATLEERIAGSAEWNDLHGADAPRGLNRLQSARVGAPAMERRFNVRGLRLGSAYRLRVSYLWETTKGGHSSVSRNSRVCKVTDERADMTVGAGLGWIPGTAGGMVVYRVPILTKRTPALLGVGFLVTVQQGSAVLGSTLFSPNNESDVALVPGARCVEGEPVVVQLDGAGRIDESDETNNVVSVPCAPAAAPLG